MTAIFGDWPQGERGDRELAVYHYLNNAKDWRSRETIMAVTGFDYHRNPIIAYVEFVNSVDRLNSRLVHEGLEIEGGFRTGERYRLARIEKAAA